MTVLFVRIKILFQQRCPRNFKSYIKLFLIQANKTLN